MSRTLKTSCVLILIALCVWFSLTHGALAQRNAAPRTLGLLTALTPPLACWVLAAWPTRLRWPAALVALVLLASLLHTQPRQLDHIRALWMLDHVSANLALAAFFGLSLRGGRKPLISRFAERLHGALSPLQARYTRAVTLGWSIAFIGVALVSAALFALAPFRIWAEFAWLSVLPLYFLLFLLEFVCRCMVIPKDQRSGFVDTVRVVARHGLHPAAQRSR